MNTAVKKDAKIKHLKLNGPKTAAFRNAIMEDQRIHKKPLPLTKSKRRALILLTTQNKKCLICGYGVSVDDVSIHHFIPISRGGKKHGVYNQTATHQSCNNKKGNSDPSWIEWLRYVLSSRRKLHAQFDLIDLRKEFPELEAL